MSTFFPTYQADELQNFANTTNSENRKRNVTSIVNRVYNDVLRAAKNGYYSSTTDITGITYIPLVITEAIAALRSIFPSPSVVTGPSPTSSTKTFIVTWEPEPSIN
jgi:hypothetical protein